MPSHDPFPNQYDETTERRPLWWWFLVMPGHLLLWLEFMFPQKGQVWASRRRYGNRYVAIVRTLSLYALIAFGVFAWANTRPSTPRASAEATSPSSAQNGVSPNLNPSTEPAPSGATDGQSNQSETDEPSSAKDDEAAEGQSAPSNSDNSDPSDKQTVMSATSLYQISHGVSTAQRALAVGTQVEIVGAFGNGWKHVWVLDSNGGKVAEGYVPAWALDPAGAAGSN